MGRSRSAQPVLVLIVAILCVLSSAPAHTATWFVTPSGNDGSDCQTASTPCLTINGAIAKAAGGDTVLVSEGTYTAISGDEVVLISKSVTLSGGWDADFATQGSTSIIDGGGIRRGLKASGSTVSTVDRFSIRHGFSDFHGGGIRVETGSNLTLNDCVVSGNSTYNRGGGISNSGDTTVNNTTISGNSASGGIIDYYHYLGVCGGIAQEGGALALNNSTVSGNSSGDLNFPSAIFTTGGTLAVNNSTVSGNNGYGVYIYLPTAVVINNSTISSNGSSGVRNTAGGEVLVQNTIISGHPGNGAWPVECKDCCGSMSSGGYNLIGNNSGCSLAPGPGDQVGTPVAPIDPKLLPLQANGGSTATHALLSGSPARNSGNPAAPGSGGNACLATDQRGQSRPEGSVCDIGAFEGFVSRVASIRRIGPNPSIAASVEFEITFTDPVTGVNTAEPFRDFGLTTTGVTGASIIAVAGSGDTYTVSVQTGDGDGTIRLDLEDDDSIINTNSNPLGGIGIGNGDFTEGEIYTIWGNPRVTSVVRAGPDPADASTVDFTVTFSEPVSGVDLAPPFTDFALATDGVFGAVVRAVSGSGDTYGVTVAFNTPSRDGTVRLDVMDDDSIVDALGNPLGGEGVGNGDFTSGGSYTVNMTPVLLSPAGRIPTATPRFEWSKVARATRYRYQLFRGSTLFSTRIVSSMACGDTTCSDRPATRLRMTTHKWRTQALVDGRWRRYSAYNTFTASPRAGYWWSNDYLDFVVQPDFASLSEFSLYVYVEGCGIYVITYPDLVPITDGGFAFKGSFYASGNFSTPFRVSGKVGLRMHYLSDCGYVSGGPFSWTGDWEAPALLDPAAANSDQVSVKPMRAYRAGPFRVDPVAP